MNAAEPQGVTATPVLQGIRVLDLGRTIAGPFGAGPFGAAPLGDLGTEVIRVERVDGCEERFVIHSRRKRVQPVRDRGYPGT